MYEPHNLNEGNTKYNVFALNSRVVNKTSTGNTAMIAFLANKQRKIMNTQLVMIQSYCNSVCTCS